MQLCEHTPLTSLHACNARRSVQTSVAETLVAACRRMEHAAEVAAHVAIRAYEAYQFPRLVRVHTLCVATRCSTLLLSRIATLGCVATHSSTHSSTRLLSGHNKAPYVVPHSILCSVVFAALCGAVLHSSSWPLLEHNGAMFSSFPTCLEPLLRVCCVEVQSRSLACPRAPPSCSAAGCC